VLGDSNNPNPPTGGLGYGKSQDFGLNLTAMPRNHDLLIVFLVHFVIRTVTIKLSLKSKALQIFICGVF